MIQITDLVKLKLCPYRFYLERIKKRRVPTTSEVYTGTVYHKIAEETAKRENQIFRELESGYSSRKIFDVLYAEYCRVIRNVILRRKKKLTSLDLDSEILMENLRAYYKEIALDKAVFMKKALERHDVEVEIESVEYYIENRELGLVGKIDRVEVHKGMEIPVEIKTVEKKRPTFSEMLQLAGYALLLEWQRDTTISEGIIEYPLKRIRVDIPDKLKDYVMLLKDYAQEILAGEIPDKVRTDRCDRCHFYDECWR